MNDLFTTHRDKNGQIQHHDGLIIFNKMIVSLVKKHFINRKDEEHESTSAKSIR